MWIYWISNTHSDNVSFIMSRNLNELEIHTVGTGNQQLRFIPTAGVYLDTEAGLIQANQWYHIAFVYDPSASYARCYINGVEKTLTKSGASSLSAAITQSSLPIRIGRRKDDWYPFHGKIDEVRIWDVVRSQIEIAGNMSSELTGSEPGLVAYFKMNDGSGTSASDLSSNNYTATLTNGPTWVVSEMVLPVELVATLTDRVEPAGLRGAVWNAQNFPSGLYIATMDAISVDGGKHFSSSKKLVLMK